MIVVLVFSLRIFISETNLDGMDSQFRVVLLSIILLSSFANRLSSQGSEASHGKKTWCYVSFLEQQHRAFTWTCFIWLYLVSHPDIYNSMYISISLVLFAIHLFHPNAKVDHTRTNSHHSRCQSTHIATSTEMSCILESY